MRVVAVGDCGVDRYLNLKADRAGGIALNFAVNAQTTFPHDAVVTVISALGNDQEAACVRDAVAGRGLVAMLPELAGRTSLQVIDREPSGEKVFVRYEAGVLADYRVGKKETSAIASSDVLLLACYRQVMGYFKSALAVPSSGLRAVDFLDLNDHDDRLRPVVQSIASLDIGFAGLGAGDTALIDALERLARGHGKLFVVTLGAAGGVALGGSQRLTCPAAAVHQVVDTTGAGDSFAAGFLARYVLSRDAGQSLAAGARQAADTVQRFGAFEAELVPWPRGVEPV